MLTLTSTEQCLKEHHLTFRNDFIEPYCYIMYISDEHISMLYQFSDSTGF